LNLILDAEPVQQVAGWSQADMWMGLGMVALFGAVMYFMIYLPQKKRDKKLKEQMDKLCIGDKVVTIGIQKVIPNQPISIKMNDSAK
jgi:preprotein translocase YajC subunit